MFVYIASVELDNGPQLPWAQLEYIERLGQWDFKLVLNTLQALDELIGVA